MTQARENTAEGKEERWMHWEGVAMPLVAEIKVQVFLRIWYGLSGREPPQCHLSDGFHQRRCLEWGRNSNEGLDDRKHSSSNPPWVIETTAGGLHR